MAQALRIRRGRPRRPGTGLRRRPHQPGARAPGGRPPGEGRPRLPALRRYRRGDGHGPGDQAGTSGAQRPVPRPERQAGRPHHQRLRRLPPPRLPRGRPGRRGGGSRVRGRRRLRPGGGSDEHRRTVAGRGPGPQARRLRCADRLPVRRGRRRSRRQRLHSPVPRYCQHPVGLRPGPAGHGVHGDGPAPWAAGTPARAPE